MDILGEHRSAPHQQASRSVPHCPLQHSGPHLRWLLLWPERGLEQRQGTSVCAPGGGQGVLGEPGETPWTSRRGSPRERAGRLLDTCSLRAPLPAPWGPKGSLAWLPSGLPGSQCALPRPPEHPGIVPPGQTQQLEAGPPHPIVGEAWGEKLWLWNRGGGCVLSAKHTVRWVGEQPNSRVPNWNRLHGDWARRAGHRLGAQRPSDCDSKKGEKRTKTCTELREKDNSSVSFLFACLCLFYLRYVENRSSLKSQHRSSRIDCFWDVDSGQQTKDPEAWLSDSDRSTLRDHVQGRPCGFSGQRCADSPALQAPKCHLPPKHSPALGTMAWPLRPRQPEPSCRFLGGSGRCPLGWNPCLPEAVTSSRGPASRDHFVLTKQAFNLWNAFTVHDHASSQGLHEILGDLSHPANREGFDLADRCLPADTRRDWRRRGELNKKWGVSSQKVAYLCRNSLTPSVAQRSGLLMGREQIGGCHLWLFQGGGGSPFTVRGQLTLSKAQVLQSLTLTCFVVLPSLSELPLSSSGRRGSSKQEIKWWMESLYTVLGTQSMLSFSSSVSQKPNQLERRRFPP